MDLKTRTLVVVHTFITMRKGCQPLFYVLKNPYVLFIISILSFLGQEFFTRLNNEWFIFISYTIIVICLLAMQYFSVSRTDEEKLIELKHFIVLFQEIGTDIIKTK